MKKRNFLLPLLIVFVIFTSFVIAQELRKSTTLVPRSGFYPKMPATITFDHKTHATTDCQTCHLAAATAQRASDNLVPGMQSCETCHTEKSDSPSPKISQCSGCHNGFSKNGKPGEHFEKTKPQPMVLPRPQAKLRFNHAKHVSVFTKNGVKNTCESCHDMASSKLPSEASCLNCHDGKGAQEGTSLKTAECQTCHVTSDKTKRLVTKLSATKTLRPSNHETDWIKRHGLISRNQPDECASCHVENECAKCHTEKVATPFSVHPPNFLAVHSLNAKGNLGTCDDCHNSQTFCFECHTDAKVTTRLTKTIPSKKTFHPPGWIDATTASNHGVNARRNIAECASCHQERDCIACHDGINPHPADFAFNCKSWLAADSRPCAKCHQDLNALSGLCR